MKLRRSRFIILGAVADFKSRVAPLAQGDRQTRAFTAQARDSTRGPEDRRGSGAAQPTEPLTNGNENWQ
jgi:hypothetical protein